MASSAKSRNKYHGHIQARLHNLCRFYAVNFAVKPDIRLLDLNQHIRIMETLLKDSLGADVGIELNLDGGLSGIEADPSHLEEIIMSLVLNARDAMLHTGTLTLRESPAQSGALQ